MLLCQPDTVPDPCGLCVWRISRHHLRTHRWLTWMESAMPEDIWAATQRPAWAEGQHRQGFNSISQQPSWDLGEPGSWGPSESPDMVEKVGSRGSSSLSSRGLRFWHILPRNQSLWNHITSHLQWSIYLHFARFHVHCLSFSKRTLTKKRNYSRKLRRKNNGKANMYFTSSEKPFC